MLKMDIQRNNFIQPLLTDFYQISMAYAYWKVQKTSDHAIFDLFFRKNPFSGEFTLFAGLDDCLDFLKNFRYSAEDVEYLKRVLPSDVEPEFLEFMRNVTADEVKLYAIDEGSVVFPRVPLLRIEGPLVICQLLETTLLNLVNYSSLVATNAARFRIAAGESIQLLEFGLRRAQGPDGGLSASRFCYIGGFDGTSNVLAGKLYDIPVKGTHAHAYVSSFSSPSDIAKPVLRKADGIEEPRFLDICVEWRRRIAPVIGFLDDQTHKGEFAAFVAYALSFPTAFLCLVDTYDTLKSGVPNFCAVALALQECGYRPVGIRIDSGDLAYLSVAVRVKFTQIAESFKIPWFAKLNIVASNDINEDTIHSLNQQGHSIDSYGIGTHLVTCQKQPALGCVYKLVELNGRPTIKLSEDIGKMTIPGTKEVYRLFGKDGQSLLDYMQRPGEEIPKPNERVLCRHPYHAAKRAYVVPASVEPLYKLCWDKGKIMVPRQSLIDLRNRAINSLATVRQDHKRALNPTPYKVSVSDKLYQFTQELWLQSAPIGELS